MTLIWRPRRPSQWKHALWMVTCPLNGESIRRCVKGNNLLARSEQLIKLVAILKPDVCVISGRHICAPRRSTNMGHHMEPYKFLLHILKNNSAAENCTDVRLGQVVNLTIFYNIWNSWLQTFHGFDFSFRWRDRENHQLANYVDCMLAYHFYDP